MVVTTQSEKSKDPWLPPNRTTPKLVGRRETPQELGDRLRREEIFRRHVRVLVAAIRSYEIDPDWPGHSGELLRAADAAETALQLEILVDNLPKEEADYSG